MGKSMKSHYIESLNLIKRKRQKNLKFSSSLSLDPTFSPLGQPDEYDVQMGLLDYFHHVYKVNEKILIHFKEYRSMDLKKKRLDYFLHSYVYGCIFGDNEAYINQRMLLAPTLSIRTVRLNSFESVKFGLPMRLGGVIRLLKKEEILHSLSISDYIKRNVPTIHELAFEFDNYGIISENENGYGTLCRSTDTNADEYVPIGLIFYALQKFNKSSTNKFFLELTLDTLRSIILDILKFTNMFDDHACVIEFHGQNLSARLDKGKKIVRQYLYRDMGNSYVADAELAKAGVTDYYNENYQFKALFHPQQDRQMKWRIFWAVIYGTLLYTSQKILAARQIKFDVYDWFKSEGIQKKCEKILILS